MRLLLPRRESNARAVRELVRSAFDVRRSSPGWTKETVIAILGGADLDLSSSPPGPDARLTAVAILGGMKILLAPGTRVSVSGFALLGGREVTVSQRGDGPEIEMSLWAFLGGIEVKEMAPTVMA